MLRLFFLAVFLAAPTWVSGEPQPVTVEGSASHIMEPFLSPDGEVLFFNNRNLPTDQTDLFWARRLDDTTFVFQGRVQGANSSALDGVPTMALDGRLCFVSVRSYFETLRTVYCGKWTGAGFAGLELLPPLGRERLGRLVFDVELSADGRELILAEGVFGGGPVPQEANLFLARQAGEGFRIEPGDSHLFAQVNTDQLEYGAALSPDGLTLLFTRSDGQSAQILMSQRAGPQAPFGPPSPLSKIEGFAEAPTFTPDGQAIYFHHRSGGQFRLMFLPLD